jgi:hypothetical protein
MGKMSVFRGFTTRPWFLISTVIWVSFVFFKFFWPLTNPWPSLQLIADFNRFPEVGFPKRWEVWKESLLALATGFWVLGLFWSCGRRLSRWLFIAPSSPGLAFCLDVGLGVFFFNAFWMGLGLVKLWFEAIWLPGALLFSVYFIHDFLGILKRKTDGSKPQKAASFWVILVFPYSALLLLHSLLPETFYDSLNYFLGMPHFWLFQHGITDYPTHLLSGYFHGGSLFFLSGFVLAGTEGAKVLSALVLGLCAVFAANWIREISGFPGEIVTKMAVLTFPLLYLNCWAVRVDGLLTFILLLFFYCLEKGSQEPFEKRAKSWFLTAGLFSCLAISVKPTAVVGIMAAFIALFWQNGFSFLKKWRLWTFFPVFFALEVGPWLMKNAVFTGNAFFPYALFWMGGRQFSHSGYERLLGENRQYLPMDHGIGSLLALPWHLTMPQGGNDQFIGPLFLAFLPVLFFLKTQNVSLKFLIKTMVLIFIFGLSLSHMLRFSIPAFILALMILSAILTSQNNRFWNVIWTGSVAACAILCFGAYLDKSATFFDGTGIWTGRETRQDYLNRKLQNSYQPLVQWTDDHLPGDSRLLIVGDSRGVYYRRPYYANSVFDDQFLALAARQSGSPQGILNRIKEFGITHVVVNATEGIRNSNEYHQYELNDSEWKRLNDFISLGLEPLYYKNFQAVYQVKPELASQPGPYAVNLFSFLSSPAGDFIKDVQSQHYEEGKIDLEKILRLFPGEKYWLDMRKRFAQSPVPFNGKD